MNIFFITLIIFVLAYIFLSWFAKTSTKKISKMIRLLIIISSILLALIMAYAGRYIFSLPFVLAILPLIKTKAGISLFQLLRLWGLFRVLKNSDTDLMLLRQNKNKILSFINDNITKKNILIVCYDGKSISPFIIYLYIAEYSKIDKRSIYNIMLTKDSNLSSWFDLSLFYNY